MKKSLFSILFLSQICFGFFFYVSPSIAGDVADSRPVIHLDKRVPSESEISSELLSDRNCEQLRKHGFLCMGIRPVTAKFSMQSDFFEIGSADLPAELRSQLDAFANVMRNITSERYRFEITGHADASGDNAFNQALSKKRAQAVKQYLAQRGVSQNLITVTGQGSQALADPKNPYAAKNRRVEIGRKLN